MRIQEAEIDDIDLFKWIKENEMSYERFYNLSGIVTILAAGAFHLYRAPEVYSKTPYLGGLFFAYFILSILAAFGIYKGTVVSAWLQTEYMYLKGSFFWGWALGFLLAVGSLLLYLVSRTIDLLNGGAVRWGNVETFVAILIQVGFMVLFYRWHPVTLHSGSNKKVSRQVPVAPAFPHR